MGHPERDMPFCVRDYRISDGAGTVLYEGRDNHQTRNTVRLPQPVIASELRLEVLATHGAPAAVFEMRCYEK